MKKHFTSTLLISFGLLFFFPSCNKKQGEDPVPSTINAGLVAHYSFEGNTNDVSGNNHHASLWGAVLTSDRKGKTNSAYQLDGFDDFLSVDAITDFGNSNFTYSAWVKPLANPGANSYSCLISIGNAGADQAMTINNNYHNTVGINVGGYNNTTTTSSTSVDSKQLPALNEWVHITYTRSNTDVKLYVNGVQKASVSTNGTLPKYTTPLIFTIGTRYNTSEAFFNGSMDEVKIYNRVLSPAEVEELYKL